MVENKYKVEAVGLVMHCPLFNASFADTKHYLQPFLCVAPKLEHIFIFGAGRVAALAVILPEV